MSIPCRFFTFPAEYTAALERLRAENQATREAGHIVECGLPFDCAPQYEKWAKQIFMRNDRQHIEQRVIFIDVDQTIKWTVHVLHGRVIKALKIIGGFSFAQLAVNHSSWWAILPVAYGLYHLTDAFGPAPPAHYGSIRSAGTCSRVNDYVNNVEGKTVDPRKHFEARVRKVVRDHPNASFVIHHSAENEQFAKSLGCEFYDTNTTHGVGQPPVASGRPSTSGHSLSTVELVLNTDSGKQKLVDTLTQLASPDGALERTQTMNQALRLKAIATALQKAAEDLGESDDLTEDAVSTESEFGDQIRVEYETIDGDTLDGEDVDDYDKAALMSDVLKMSTYADLIIEGVTVREKHAIGQVSDTEVAEYNAKVDELLSALRAAKKTVSRDAPEPST